MFPEDPKPTEKPTTTTTVGIIDDNPTTSMQMPSDDPTTPIATNPEPPTTQVDSTTASMETVAENEKFDCYPDNAAVTQEMCLERGYVSSVFDYLTLKYFGISVLYKCPVISINSMLEWYF